MEKFLKNKRVAKLNECTEVRDNALNNLWHTWPNETPPREAGTYAKCLLRGLSQKTGRITYIMVNWFWEDDKPGIPKSYYQGWFQDGNYLSEFDEYEDQFEWLYLTDLETEDIRELTSRPGWI